LFKKQSHLEALYGKNVRDLSPHAKGGATVSQKGGGINGVESFINKSLTRSQIDEISQFNQYLKNLPNFEFKKQSKKESYIAKLSGSVHFKRFDNFDNFPKIFSKNKKIVVNLDFGRLSGRDDLVKPQNTPLFYDVSYSQVDRRPPAPFIDSGSAHKKKA
jgi:hypothetical protein